MGQPHDLLSVAPRAGLVSVRVPAPLVPLESFLRLALPGDALLWQGRDELPVAARGAVARLDLAPGEPLSALSGRAAGSAEVDRRTRAPDGSLAADPAPAATEPGLRWYGGVAFASRAPGDDWRGFGAASFVLPRLAYEPGEQTAWLRLNLRADELADAGAWLATVDRVVGELGVEAQTRHAGENTNDRGHMAHHVASAAGPTGRVVADSAEAYERVVSAALDAIAGGLCEKIVAARALTVAVTGDAVATLGRLGDEGLVRFAFGRGDALFFGATPERLVQLTGRVLSTEALAGTIAADEAQAGRRLLASDKDAREHRVVVATILA
ncbi:MAG: hypothetical protein EOO75_12565, partial [Myxococcales bacterium]